MQTFRVIGQVDSQGHLAATVPSSIGPGEVEVVVIARRSNEDEAGDQWMAGVAREWHDDLADPRQDIYSPTDGVPADGPR
jgi:hypothetical protein